MPPKGKRTFRGFQRPNYTMVPDELFDELLPDLSGAELKVLLYIIRRTFGFKKDSDNISLSQMMRGIRTANGRVLDRGVGLTKKTVLGALRSLEAQQIIISQRRQSETKGNEPTSYRLNVIGASPNGSAPLGAQTPPPSGEKVRQGAGPAITPSPRGKNYAPQETDEQETERHDSNLRRASTAEADQTDADREDNGGGQSAEWSPKRGRIDEDRQSIQAFIEDFAREFNDQAPLNSSVSRAVNLYRRARVSRAEFFSALYEARAMTRSYTASIRSREGEGRPKRKMAYFFAILEDMLGLRPN